MNIILNEKVLKLDRITSYGMVYGFEKDSKIEKISIIPSSKNSFSFDLSFFEKPPLLSVGKAFSRRYFKLSPLGKRVKYIVENENFKLPKIYAVFFDAVFFLKGDNRKTWEALCLNGLFDLWKPSETIPPSEQLILLSRVYMLENEPENLDIVTDKKGNERLSGNLKAVIKTPLIKDRPFNEIKRKILKILRENDALLQIMKIN